MHPNPAFRSETNERNIDFARGRSFGTLVIEGREGPLVSHVPFLLSDDAGHVDLHLVRSNPIARQQSGAGVIAVSGPDGYISPDWYGVSDFVPTWNYVAVHLRGRLEPLPEADLVDLLERQSAAYEARLLPKPPWSIDKMSQDALQRMLRMILPYRFHVDRIDGTWKLGQNKGAAARINAAAKLANADFGQEISELSDLMRDADPDT